MSIQYMQRKRSVLSRTLVFEHYSTRSQRCRRLSSYITALVVARALIGGSPHRSEFRHILGATPISVVLFTLSNLKQNPESNSESSSIQLCKPAPK